MVESQVSLLPSLLQNSRSSRVAPLITGWVRGPQKQFGVTIALAGASGPLAVTFLLSAGALGLDRMKQRLGGSA